MSRILFSTAALVTLALVSQPALAQNASCAKLKNAQMKAACNCHAAAGGIITEEPGGRISWRTPGGNGNMTLQACLAKTR